MWFACQPSTDPAGHSSAQGVAHSERDPHQSSMHSPSERVSESNRHAHAVWTKAVWNSQVQHNALLSAYIIVAAYSQTCKCVLDKHNIEFKHSQCRCHQKTAQMLRTYAHAQQLYVIARAALHWHSNSILQPTCLAASSTPPGKRWHNSCSPRPEVSMRLCKSANTANHMHPPPSASGTAAA